MRRIRIGLVGAGLVGQAEHAHHLAADRERFELVALADASARVRTALGRRYGIPELHPSVDDLAGLGLDAIVCATPDPFHGEVCRSALRAGLHVLCEKPLALTLGECDTIAAARDAAGRIVQVAYMKRYDPAFERLLELLPADLAAIRYVSVEVNDPDEPPFVDHLPMVAAADVPPELVAEGRRRGAGQIDEAAGGPVDAAGQRAFGGYLSSMVHDLNLVHGIVEHLGGSLPVAVDQGAWWDDGRAVALGAPLDGGGRVSVVHQNLPGVNDYTERLTVYCHDRILELTFPSPYLHHHPTRLVERRSSGRIGLTATHHHVSYEEAFRNELRAFHAAICDGEPVRTPLEAARADVAALIAAFRLARAAP
jgi:predicted dehydrogenase